MLIPLADEYDPMFPNDYEKVVKRHREERQRQREQERQKEIEEREKYGCFLFFCFKFSSVGDVLYKLKIDKLDEIKYLKLSILPHLKWLK